MENTFDKKKEALKLEVGMYEEASVQGKSLGGWLEDYRVEKGLPETEYYGLTNYEIAQKRKAMIKAGIMPPLTAFECLLKAFDIRAFGMHTDTVSKMFQSSDTSILFPEFIANRVYAGALAASPIADFLAVTSAIPALDFRKIYLQDTESERQLTRAVRMAEAPEVEISVAKQNVQLEKYWRAILYDYETIYATPLNIIAVALQRVGKQIGIDEMDDMVYALINGDGNSNGLESAQTVDVTTTGEITKVDIISFSHALPSGYELDKFVGLKADIIKYQDALSDMTNPMLQWGATGMMLPKGYKWDRSVVTTDVLIGVDSSQAIGKVTNDAFNLSETEKIIKKQKVRTVVSTRSAFDVIDQDAIGALDITP